jgi:hypothetical protein
MKKLDLRGLSPQESLRMLAEMHRTSASRDEDVDPRHDDLHLSVDDRRERPFHCDYCGDTYEACRHWSGNER